MRLLPILAFALLAACVTVPKEPPRAVFACDPDGDLVLGIAVGEEFYVSIVGHCDGERGSIGPRRGKVI